MDIGYFTVLSSTHQSRSPEFILCIDTSTPVQQFFTNCIMSNLGSVEQWCSAILKMM